MLTGRHTKRKTTGKKAHCITFIGCNAIHYEYIVSDDLKKIVAYADAEMQALGCRYFLSMTELPEQLNFNESLKVL